MAMRGADTREVCHASQRVPRVSAKGNRVEVMAADAMLTISEAALENASIASIRDAYRRELVGRVCRLHGRGVTVSESKEAGELYLAGCCEAFVREARLALPN